jgi:hypothetical protein
LPVLTQKRWRWVGAICLALCAVMVPVGAQWPALRTSLVLLAVYWSVFLVILVSALYCALLDMRFIRLQYKLAERQIFQETLGDEEFRRALRGAKQGDGESRRPR